MKKFSLFTTLLFAAFAMTACEKNTPEDTPGLVISGPSEFWEGDAVQLSVQSVSGAETYKWFKYNEMVQHKNSLTCTIKEGGVYKVAAIGSSGNEIGISPALKVTMKIPFLNRLVGKWDVTEYAYQNNFYANSHVLTIKKVNGTTIDIENFSGWNTLAGQEWGTFGDTVRATVDNDAQTLLLPAGFEFTPSWYSGYHSYLTPLFYLGAYSINDSWGKEFPPQSFTEEGGTLKMEMFTDGKYTETINGEAVIFTHGVVVPEISTSYGMPAVALFANTVWTKQVEE